MYTVGCQQGDIRLVNGQLINQGRVEICVGNAWSAICQSGWDDDDARVVCRQLGFSVIGKDTITYHDYIMQTFLG